MKLFEKPGYETIIGDGRHLTEYMQNLIKEGKISDSFVQLVAVTAKK